MKTCDYLFFLNLGPQTICVLCGLHFELAKHIFNECPKAQLVWPGLTSLIGRYISFLNGLTTSSRIDPNPDNFSMFTISIIAATIWFIWKIWCNCKFKNEVSNFNSIATKSLAHVKEYYNTSSSSIGKNLIISNFNATFFTNGNDTSLGGADFFTMDSNYVISIAGSNLSYTNSILDTEIKALTLALHHARSSNNTFIDIFISSSDMLITIMVEVCILSLCFTKEETSTLAHEIYSQ